MALELSLRILTAEELKVEQTLCIPLVSMINEAYSKREGEGLLSRFSDPDAIWKELGNNGLCVILQDPEHGDIPVAVAGAKRWKKGGCGEGGGEDLREWEISPVATRINPSYRKKGLVDRCLAVLYSALLERVEEGQKLKLWVQVVENYYGDYWRRKGYNQVGPEWIIAKGVWHKDYGFTLIDMCKNIQRDGIC
jgi:hypothetical protein